MYQFILPLHNFVRWFFLAAALYAIYKALMGMRGSSPFTKADKTAGTLYVASAHSQLLLGLLLWFLSPNVQMGLSNMGMAMKDKLLRMQTVEHPLVMIIAVVLIQVGSIRAKKAYADADKHKRSLIFYTIALILVLSQIPWGSSPLFRV